MSIQLKNNATTLLTTAIDASQTTIDMGGSAALFPVIKDGEHFLMTIIDQTDAAILEIVKVNSIAGTTFNVVRGYEGTTPRAAIIDDIVELRLTEESVKELILENDKRIYLDEIYLSYLNTKRPNNAIDMAQNNLRNAPILMDTWDSYWGPRVKCLAQNKITGEIWHNLSFPTIQDMYNWMMANSTINGSGYAQETLMVMPYEVISQDIPVMTRMYGLNRFLSSLKGKKNYTAGNGIANVFMSGSCATIANSMLGSTFTASTANVNNVIWVTRAKKNMYSIPRVKKRQQYRFDSLSSRRYVENGGALSSNHNGIHFNNDTDNIKYAYLPHNSYNCVMIGTNFSDQRELLHNQSDGASCLMCIEVVEEADNHNRAVVVKPLGIDQIIIDHPDFDKYDLEFVYFNKDKQNHVHVKTISNLGDLPNSDADPNQTKIRINSREWLNTPVAYNSATGNFNEYKWDTVRFRLRDKVTGKIGDLSYSGIVTDNHKSIALRRMLVKPMESQTY